MCVYIHKYSSNQVIPVGLKMLPPRAIDYQHQQQNPETGVRLPLYSCQSEESKRLPQTIQVIVVVLGCLPEAEGKSLFDLDKRLEGSTVDLM